MDNNIFGKYLFWIGTLMLVLTFTLMFISAFFLPKEAVSNELNPVFIFKAWLEVDNNMEIFISYLIPSGIGIGLVLTVLNHVRIYKKG